jgi:hypothetical protein
MLALIEELRAEEVPVVLPAKEKAKSSEDSDLEMLDDE